MSFANCLAWESTNATILNEFSYGNFVEFSNKSFIEFPYESFIEFPYEFFIEFVRKFDSRWKSFASNVIYALICISNLCYCTYVIPAFILLLYQVYTGVNTHYK